MRYNIVISRDDKCKVLSVDFEVATQTSYGKVV